MISSLLPSSVCSSIPRASQDTGVLLTAPHPPAYRNLVGGVNAPGDMIHKGVECEDGVQDQLVLGSLKSS